MPYLIRSGSRRGPASIPARGGSRRSLPPPFPASSRQGPDCSEEGRGPASVPLPGGGRRSLPPVFPGPSGAAQIAVGLGVVRLQFQRAAVTGDRFLQFSLALQRAAQGGVGLGIVRLQLQRRGGRRRSPPRASLGSARRRPDCCARRHSSASVPGAAVSGDCLARLLLVDQGIAQIEICLGKAGI